MSTLSQFFPSGGDDGLLIYSKQINWAAAQYVDLSSPFYIDGTYLTVGTAIDGGTGQGLIFSQAGDYKIKIQGMTLGDNSFMRAGMYKVNASNSAQLAFREHAVGVNATYLQINLEDPALLKGLAQNQRLNIFCTNSGALYNTYLEIYKK